MKDQTVWVLGYGRSGKAAVRLAAQLGAKVIVSDEQSLTECPYPFLRFVPGVPAPKADLAVISPGIDPKSDFGRWIYGSGVPVRSELAFGAAFMPVPMLAVTGTNGKTTTTELTVHFLKALGIAAEATGNIGHALCAAVADRLAGITETEVFVTEVSSFQLEAAENIAPFSAVLLNITSDHLNRYDSFKAYGKIKFKLFKHPAHCAVRSDWKGSFEKEFGRLPVTFSATDPNSDWTLVNKTIFYHHTAILNLETVALPGDHNAENLMAALALVTDFVPNWRDELPSLQVAAESFRLSAHRVERIAEWDDMCFINDSKATNPDAVLAALKLVGGRHNVRLLLGGLDKEMDFSLLNDGAGSVAKAYLYGQCAKRIAAALTFPYELFSSFDDAFEAAFAAMHRGEVLLLSPACASMDQFRDYAARGEAFRANVLRKLSERCELPRCQG